MHHDSTTEKAILLAAEAEFVEKGFIGARTVSIAQRAGVTHAMLHYYYRTKEQLFERVFLSKLTVMIDSVFELLIKSEEAIGLKDRIEAFCSSHYQYLADNSKLPLFVLNEVVHNPARIEMLRAMMLQKLASVNHSLGAKYAQGIATGEIAQVDMLTLIIDILLMNLSSIVMRPLLQSLTQSTIEQYDAWRLEENITMIRKRITP